MKHKIVIPIRLSIMDELRLLLTAHFVLIVDISRLFIIAPD